MNLSSFRGRCLRGCALILVVVSPLASFWSAGFDRTVGWGVSMQCVLNDCLNQTGLADQHFYLYAGSKIASGDALDLVSHSDIWILSLWPPGQSMLFAMAIVLAQLGLPIVVVVAVISCALWSILLSIPVLLTHTFSRLLVTTAIGCSIPFLYFMKAWPLGDGVLFADGNGTVLLISALVVLTFVRPSYPLVTIPISLIAGLLLAASAYFRATNEVVINFLTAFAIAYVVVWVGWRMVRYPLRRRDRLRGYSFGSLPKWLTSLLLMVLFAQVLMLPWRIIVHERINGGISFSAATDDLWARQWAPAKFVSALGVWSGSNSMCRAYPDRCLTIETVEVASNAPYTGEGFYSQEDFRHITIQVLTDNPLPFIRDRIGLLKYFWGFNRYHSTTQIVEATVNIVILLVVFVLSLVRLVRWRDPLLLLSLAVLVLAALGPTFLIHFEYRYLLPLQAAVVLLACEMAVGRRHKVRLRLPWAQKRLR